MDTIEKKMSAIRAQNLQINSSGLPAQVHALETNLCRPDFFISKYICRRGWHRAQCGQLIRTQANSAEQRQLGFKQRNEQAIRPAKRTANIHRLKQTYK